MKSGVEEKEIYSYQESNNGGNWAVGESETRAMQSLVSMTFFLSSGEPETPIGAPS